MKFAFSSHSLSGKTSLKSKIFLALGIALALVLLFAFTFTVVLVAIAGGALAFILNLFSGRSRQTVIRQKYSAPRPAPRSRHDNDDDIIDI